MEELVTRHSAIMDKYDPEKKMLWLWMNGVDGMMWNREPMALFYTSKIPCGMQ